MVTPSQMQTPNSIPTNPWHRSMLGKFGTMTTLAASDMDRARTWYHEKLGMKPVEQSEGGLVYESGGTKFYLYPSAGAGTAQHTQMG